MYRPKQLLILLWSFLSAFCFSYATEMDKLSLEEKVGQVLMVHFRGTTAGDEARTLIQDTKVGGIIYYNWSNGLSSPEQVRTLSAELQRLASTNHNPLPLFIAVDQEGGVVSRLKEGFTQFPGNGALGAAQMADLAEESAFAMGQEMHAVGVNMNLAPVVDVNSNPRNPIIGIRSFSDSPQTVAEFGERAVCGYKRAHVLAVIKHFPGYGAVSVDPHEALPINTKSMNELACDEFVPFAHLASKAEAVMTAHIYVPALDAENCATLSRPTMRYLKEVIGFQGLVVTDSMIMEGVLSKERSVDEAVIQALNAGSHLIILGGRLLDGFHAGFELTVSDIQRIHTSVVAAVHAGRIPQATLDTAVEKIIALKKKYAEFSPPPTQEVQAMADNHRAIAARVAKLAVQKIRGDPVCFLSREPKNIVAIAPQILKEPIEQLQREGMQGCFFTGLSPSNAEIVTAIEAAKNADATIVFSYNAWKNPAQQRLIQSVLDAQKLAVLVATRDPLDASLFPQAELIYVTFSPTGPSLQAACAQFLAKVQ